MNEDEVLATMGRRAKVDTVLGLLRSLDIDGAPGIVPTTPTRSATHIAREAHSYAARDGEYTVETRAGVIAYDLDAETPVVRKVVMLFKKPPKVQE